MYKTLIPLVGVILSVPLFAASFNCPSEIHTDQALKEIPSGWKSFIDTKNEDHRLLSVSFYDGPPQSMTDLVPDNPGSNDPPVWTFSKAIGRAYWEVCHYADTSVKVTKQLPGSIKRCSVVYSKDSEIHIYVYRLIEDVICE